MIRTSLLIFFLLLSCSKNRAISVDTYVHFAAKEALIRDYCRHLPDSLAAYMAGLHKSEGVTPEQIALFISKTDKEPEHWIDIQQKIAAEMEKLNPSLPAPAIPKH